MLLRLHRWQARARERGAVSVEFALIFFFLFLPTTFALIYGGLAFSKQLNVTQAAREASRYGSTYNASGVTPGTSAWLNAVLTSAEQAAGPANDPMGGFDYICVAYVVTDSSGSVVTGSSNYIEARRTNGATVSPGSITAGACPTWSAPKIASTTYVQVGIQRASQFFFVLANPSLSLDSVSTTPFEARTS